MPANQLETVEIMSQPSAKFDASGNSGVINIKTKKSRQSGFNGSVNLNYIQGWYPKSPNSINLNFRKNKISVFANYGFSYWQGANEVAILRKFRASNGNPASIFDQNSFQRNRGKNQNLRLGMDYQVDKKTTVGIGINGTYNPREYTSSSISDIYNSKVLPDSSNLADTKNKDPWRHMGLNLNFRKQFDTTGRELTADVDYVWYSSRNKQYSNNYTFIYPDNIISDSFLLKGDLPSDIKIYSAKLDYVHPLQKGAKIEAGLKSSLVRTDNNALFTTFDDFDQKWITDVSRSNHFIYTENILAAYINYRKQIKKWGIQGGLRYEHTLAEGKQKINNKNFDRNYGQLFPTAYVSYAMTEKNTFGFSYGRRIQRPNYQDMNPFQYFLDQYTYNTGNPNLTPQFSHNLELSHNYKGQLNTALNYSVTTDIINDILKQNTETKVTFQTKENIAKRTNIGLSLSYNKPITKWWTVSLYSNVFNNRFEGFVNNNNLKVNITSFLGTMNNQFRFNKGWGAEVSGFYRTSMQEGGIIVSKPMGVLSFGASKQVLNGKGTVKLNITDPFYLQYFRGYTKFGDIDAEITSRWDNRRVGLGFTYRFGKMQNNQPSRRKTGSSQDEQNRVGDSQQ
jgi:outer membrane receptor protein involved in Fe transport